MFFAIGCGDENVDSQLFEIGQKVCVGDTLPFDVGEICGFEKGEVVSGESYRDDVYHISVYKKELKGNIILKRNAKNILEFIEDVE